jgi:hypothetical protein
MGCTQVSEHLRHPSDVVRCRLGLVPSCLATNASASTRADAVVLTRNVAVGRLGHATLDTRFAVARGHMFGSGLAASAEDGEEGLAVVLLPDEGRDAPGGEEGREHPQVGGLIARG